MNEQRDRTDSPKRHRLAWSSALAVLLVGVCAPLAGAAGVQVPGAPQTPQVPQLPLPIETPPLPGLPEVDPAPVVPDVTTLPAPVQELEEAVDPVVDDVTGVVDDVTGGAGEVVDDVGGVVDEVTDPVGEVVDDVTDPEGPVGGVVDEVTDPVGEVVDDVTDPEGPVGGVVDEVTDTVDGVTGGNLGETVDGVVDEVGGIVDGVGEALPGTPDVPAPGTELPDATDPQTSGSARFPAGGSRPSSQLAAAVGDDGFAAGALAVGGVTPAAIEPPLRDVGAPSLVERIARSASEIARKIAFPLLLAFMVGAFVVIQNRMDRKDPKLALAAIDADEDLLSFE